MALDTSIQTRLQAAFKKQVSENPNPMTLTIAISRMMRSSLDNSGVTDTVAFYQKVADMLAHLLVQDGKDALVGSMPPVPTEPGGYASISVSSYYDKLYFWANASAVLPHLMATFIVSLNHDLNMTVTWNIR